jgi:hypothetical protein
MTNWQSRCSGLALSSDLLKSAWTVIDPRSGAAPHRLLRVCPKADEIVVWHDRTSKRACVLDRLLVRGYKLWFCLKAACRGANVSDLSRASRSPEEDRRGQLYCRNRLHSLGLSNALAARAGRVPRPRRATRESAGYWIGDKAIGRSRDRQLDDREADAHNRIELKQVLSAHPETTALQIDRSHAEAVADWLPAETSTLFIWLPTFRRSVFGALDGVAQPTAMPLDLVSPRRSIAGSQPAGRIPRQTASSAARIRSKPRASDVDETALSGGRLTLCSLLAAADCLITDASSVWVDTSLNRP